MAAMLSGLAGCQAPGPPAAAAAQKQVAELEDQAQQLRQRVANQQETIESQRRQIADLQRLGPQRPARLSPLEQIRFARLSGPYDANNDGVPDGIVLYVRPVDASGDALKAAGELTVRLFDLADPQGPRLIGEYHYGPDELARMWYAKLWTEHFTVRTPWPQGYEPAREITARAEFLDYLTGRTFTAQQAFGIKSVEPLRPR